MDSVKNKPGVKEAIDKIRILPIYSDPTKPDTDEDGLTDWDEVDTHSDLF